MKILHVISSLRTGGAEKLMVDLLPRMKSDGHEVSLCLFDGVETPFKKMLQEQGIPIYELSTNTSVYNPKLIIRLRKILVKGNYDIVHTHTTAPQFFTALASWDLDCKLCTTEHNTLNRRTGSVFWRRIDKWMYSKYQKIICISDKTEVCLREQIHDTSDKIVTINNGIDVNLYSN